MTFNHKYLLNQLTNNVDKNHKSINHPTTNNNKSIRNKQTKLIISDKPIKINDKHKQSSREGALCPPNPFFLKNKIC